MVTVPHPKTSPDPQAARIAERKAAVAPLNARRERCGVTQDAVAKHLGCTRPYVVNVFAGRKRATEEFTAGVVALCQKAERRAKKKTAAA